MVIFNSYVKLPEGKCHEHDMDLDIQHFFYDINLENGSKSSYALFADPL
jgi:hypothetical protein